MSAFDQTEMLQLKVRVVALEDQVKSLQDNWQRMSSAIIAAPTPNPASPVKPIAQPKTTEEKTGDDLILESFAPELRQHLTVKDGKIYSEYVSQDKYGQIKEAARNLGYHWISDGKNSHFEKATQ